MFPGILNFSKGLRFTYSKKMDMIMNILIKNTISKSIHLKLLGISQEKRHDKVLFQ